jgi:hypothetical protein
MKSWKTTVCGVLGLLGGLIAQFFPEYSRYGLFLASFGAGLGLLFARDNNVTSEQAGCAPAAPAANAGNLAGTITALVLLCLLAVTGCARLHSVQTRVEWQGTNHVETVTKNTITTFFDSHNDVAKLRASTTDKTQSLSLAGVDQGSAATNAAALASAIVDGATSAALKFVKP